MTMAAEYLGVGWGFPVRFGQLDPGSDSSPQAVVAAAYEHSVEQSIRIILETGKGERVMRPDFGCGIHDFVFEPNNASTRGLVEYEVEAALTRWEPRIEVLAVSAAASGAMGEVLIISIDYLIPAIDNRANLVYPFYLQRGGP